MGNRVEKVKVCGKGWGFHPHLSSPFKGEGLRRVIFTIFAFILVGISSNRVFCVEVSTGAIAGWAEKLTDADKMTAAEAFVNLQKSGLNIFPYIYPELVKELKALEVNTPDWFSDRTYPDQCFSNTPAERLIVDLGRAALPEMRMRVLDGDLYVRKTALYIFAREMELGDVHALLELLSDSEVDIRRRASDLLSRFKQLPGSSLSRLIHHLQRDRDDFVRLNLAQALCRNENRVGLRALLQSLFSEKAEVRAIAARALRLCTPSFRAESIKYLEKALANEKDKYAFAHIQGAYNNLKRDDDKLKAQDVSGGSK